MGNGCRGVDTPVVFTLEDLKKIYDRDAHGTKGMWAFHAKHHKGHKQCCDIVNSKCDWVVGILWNNFAAGMKWMAGETKDIDDPIRHTDVAELKQNSDVVMIFTGDYHPYKEHWEYLKNEFDREFPKSLLKRKGILGEPVLYTVLLYSVAVRILMHEIYGISVDYHASCGRDRWRHVKYTEWCKDRFKIDIELFDAARDDMGNVISGMRNRLPKELNDRINKPLLLSHFETVEEVNEHIKDIEGLTAKYLFKENGWINAKFQFSDKYWWAEGLKICK